MKKSREALSNAVSNAVSALILVVASVMLTLAVVGFAFGLIGTFSAQPMITIVYAYAKGSHLYVIVRNTGGAPGTITAYVVDGTPTPANIPVPVGEKTIDVSLPSGLSLYPGQLASFTLITGNGVNIPGTAIVES